MHRVVETCERVAKQGGEVYAHRIGCNSCDPHCACAPLRLWVPPEGQGALPIYVGAPTRETDPFPF
jgi:hypothetical protein